MTNTKRHADTDTSSQASDSGPAGFLATADRYQQRAAGALKPDPRVLYGAWGIAWLVGFSSLYAATQDSLVSPLTAWITFGALMGAALLITLAQVARTISGVGGVSARTGTMYGISWPVALAATTAIVVGVGRAGIPTDSAALLSTAAAGLAVGTLYLAGGAVCEDRAQYGLGLWILLTTAVGALSGFPMTYLVMAIGGGGGFLLGAMTIALRQRGQA